MARMIRSSTIVGPRFTLEGGSLLTGQLTDPIHSTHEEKFSPLPRSIDACARELEMLTERQRVIANRVKRVTSQLELLIVKRGEVSKVPQRRGAGAENIKLIELDEQASDSDDGSVNEPPEKASEPPEKASEEEDSNGEQSSPLILALKKLQKRSGQKMSIWNWTFNLTNLFISTDVDGSGLIDKHEYTRMIEKVDLSENLKTVLREEFGSIDVDGSGSISLEEFLLFFLKFPMFKHELAAHADSNAPFAYENSLTCTQQYRQWVYCIVECPGYNLVSKLLFCFDVGLTLVPVLMLCFEGVRPSFDIQWYKKTFMWIASIFFMFEYICGLITCKFKKKFILNIGHIFELVSFLFWIIYNTFGRAGSLDPMGFVVFRVLRLVKLHMVFKLETLKDDLDIYVNTLSLAYTSYGAVSMILAFTIIFFSLIIYVFERGNYQKTESRWERDFDEGESPFSDLWSCVYFIVVTMTTLGYGDISPKSYVGKLIAMMTVLVGLCNITFLINIIGDCFEEVFREFVVRRSERMEVEQSRYLTNCVDKMSTRIAAKQNRSNKCWKRPSEKRLIRHKRILAQANEQHNL